jgi:hypothetical protein
MKERPILFSAPMVRAILEGRKTQTRRVVSVQPPNEAGWKLSECASTTGDKRNIGRVQWLKIAPNGYEVLDSFGEYFSSKYGRAGDRLWVRETFNHSDSWYEDKPSLNWKNCRRDGKCTYVYYNATLTPAQRRERNEDPWPWTPSIFMPRWASRITLEIVSVRVERVQEISEADSISEGIQGCIDTTGMSSLRIGAEKYRELWDSINAKRDGYAWKDNPWVWVIEFKKLSEAVQSKGETERTGPNANLSGA